MGIGTEWLLGTRSLETLPVTQIKQVPLLKRTDGNYVHCAVLAERSMVHKNSGTQVGIDVGLAAFLTTSKGGVVANRRLLRKVRRGASRSIAGPRESGSGRSIGSRRYGSWPQGICRWARHTSQDGSGVLPDRTASQIRVPRALSVRTHICPRCGLVQVRDELAARNTLVSGQVLRAAS
jgi:transposase